jgi:hypothetical protein
MNKEIMAETQIDYDKMSTEELRNVALQWANGEVKDAPEPPRDADGRFVAKPAAADEPQEQIVYERTIDLGDGSGVQVFEAPTLEELVDKLAKAQENATRKIREQAAAIKAQPKDTPTAAPDELENLTEAEKFLLQQEMLTDPAKAMQRFVNKAVEKRDREIAKVAEQTKSATDTFVANTSDYYATQKNGQKMVKWLETYNLDVTESNLKQAFDDLSASGLLEARPAEAKETPVVPEGEQQSEARIEQKPVVNTVVRRKVVGGVSVKRSAPAPAPAPGLSESDLYKLPMHELEELTRKALVG